MKARNDEIGTGREGAGSRRARIGGDRGGNSAGRGDAARRQEAESADAALVMRKRTDGGGFRGRRAAKKRNAIGRVGGPRNSGRRTSASEAGSRRGLKATVNRLRKRAGGGGVQATPGTGGRTGNRGANRTTARTARGTAAARGRKTAGARPGLRTRSGARKAGKNR